MSTIRVSNAAQLDSAIDRAKAGDVIELAGGNYGRLSLKGVNFASDVTITSASDSNPAVFSYANITKSSHLVFDGVDFVTNAASGGKPFVVNQSDNVTIRDALFDGMARKGGYGDGHGIWVVRSDHFTLENSELRDFNVASYFHDQSDLVVRNNILANVAWDAMIVGGVHGAVIEGNDIDLNVAKGTKHTDGIQFWNTNINNPMSDVVVRGNHIETHGTASHGIYAANGLAATLGMKAAYSNFLIEDNVVISAQVSGIAIGEIRGLTIRDNLLLQDTDFRSGSVGRTPVIRVDADATGVSITGNVTHKEPVASGDNWAPVKSGAPSGWTIAKNKIVPIGTSLEKAEKMAAAAPLADADTLRLEAAARAPLVLDDGNDLPPARDDDDGGCHRHDAFDLGAFLAADHFDAHPI